MPNNLEENLLTAEKTPATPEVPAKFIDPETGEIRVEALLQSYQELERRLSARPAGLPESPDGYEVDVSHGLFASDGDINAKLFEKGFTLEQVQAVYDLAAEKFVPMILDLAQDFQADREVERLTAAFGGPEKFQEVSRQLLAYGKKNLPPEVLNSLAGSFEGVMALYRMMHGQEPELAGFARDETPEGEGDLQGMMRDPRYWREKDPSFVAKVTEGFQRKYNAS